MQPFDIAQGFIEGGERSEGPDMLKRAFGKAMQTLGFKHYACCSHVDPLNPPAGAVVLHDYPPKWVELFSRHGLHHIDPAFQYAGRMAVPFFWDDPAFLAGLDPTQRAVLAEAHAAGLKCGYTIPIHAPGVLPASCTVIPDYGPIDAMSYNAAHLMAVYLHAAAAGSGRPIECHSRLSPRERQCLELAAQGKSDWVIGRVLGISERTAHNHLERAKRRLGVASRTQAVVEALFAHLISFGDVLRPRLSDSESDTDRNREA